MLISYLPTALIPHPPTAPPRNTPRSLRITPPSLAHRRNRPPPSLPSPSSPSSSRSPSSAPQPPSSRKDPYDDTPPSSPHGAADRLVPLLRLGLRRRRFLGFRLHGGNRLRVRVLALRVELHLPNAVLALCSRRWCNFTEISSSSDASLSNRSSSFVGSFGVSYVESVVE